MAFIRLIHRDHYDATRGCFQDFAFKAPRRGTGISIIDYDCAIRVSGSICRHVDTFYPKFGSPTIFWPIPLDAFPAANAIAELSDTGDGCHHNITNMTDGEARRIRKGIKVEDCFICNADGTTRQLTPADLPPNPYP